MVFIDVCIIIEMAAKISLAQSLAMSTGIGNRPLASDMRKIYLQHCLCFFQDENVSFSLGGVIACACSPETVEVARSPAVSRLD